MLCSPRPVFIDLFWLSMQWGGRQQCYIGVSTPLVWAATRPPPPVPLGEDFLAPTSAAPSRPMSGKHDHTDHAETESTTSALPDGMALEGGSKPATAADAYASAAAFGALTDKDAPRRAPCLAARDVHEVEQLILRSGRKNKLRTYVVCPGLLYGCGEEEEGLHPLMRTAWEVAGPLTIYGPGTNHLPMVHVEDAASYIAAVASAEAMTALPGRVGRVMLPGVLHARGHPHGKVALPSTHRLCQPEPRTLHRQTVVVGCDPTRGALHPPHLPASFRPPACSTRALSATHALSVLPVL